MIKDRTESGRVKSSIIRTIDDHTSVRRGKYGDYVFYKKPRWKKPLFIKLQGFIKENGEDSYKTCELPVLAEWLKTQKKV